MKSIKQAILQGRTTQEKKEAVIKYADDNELTVSEAVDELISIALEKLKK